MNEFKIHRPMTLLEVATESERYEDFGGHLKDFLHEFARALKGGEPVEQMLTVEPPLMAEKFAEGKVCDAFLAATADFLARRNGLLTPAWARREKLVLAAPWFSPDLRGVRAMLLRDAPSAFKDKNIFVFESALQVA